MPVASGPVVPNPVLWRYPYWLGTDFGRPQFVIAVWKDTDQGWVLLGHEPLPDEIMDKLQSLAQQAEDILASYYPSNGIAIRSFNKKENPHASSK